MTNAKSILLNRRKTLALLGGAGAAALTGWASEHIVNAASCLALAAPQTEGPYWVEENLNRLDIRVDPSDGSVRPGVPLVLSIAVQEVTSAGCGPLAGAHVDLWHCDAGGLYSDVAANNTVGKKFLRGYQVTDDNGNVQFTTIYPGWYYGRTVHIHLRIRTYSGSTQLGVFTAQFFFDDSITDKVFTQSPYNTRGARNTRNSTDMVLTGTSGGSVLFLDLAQTSAGYSANAAVGVNLKTATSLKPAVSSGGVVSAAGYLAGITPGDWTAIFGQNLAAAARALTSSDIVDNTLPTTLGGVSVQIDSKPAFLYYVSPTQINVQAPADTNTGSVGLTVTNSAGVSDTAQATLQPLLPAFFTSDGYVAAVRPDGTAITSAVPAKPGEAIELFASGFGPTDPPIAAGAVAQTAAPLTNAVIVSIGGAQAVLAFAGLSAAGLYQFNVTVPAEGDHEVIAQIQGLRTRPGVLLRTQN
jgi:uncharacterized protein (TIGR03437 family)